jgi:Rrf2 family iron-sulfur cluster assembly transcriptional regulator
MVVDLALNDDGRPVARSEIARRQAISPDYVAQLFRSLREAGIVDGIRGPGGGYILARAAATISAADVLRAVEGPLSVVHCVDTDDDDSCVRSGQCVTQLVWRGLSETMAKYLDSVTVSDLREQALRLSGDRPAQVVCEPTTETAPGVGV